MARAIVRNYGQVEIINGIPKMQVDVTYGGSGVPGSGFLNDGVIVDITGVVDAATLATAVATAVRAEAVSRGFTVAVSTCFQPTYQAT